jgi:hypothetical protein
MIARGVVDPRLHTLMSMRPDFLDELQKRRTGPLSKASEVLRKTASAHKSDAKLLAGGRS